MLHFNHNIVWYQVVLPVYHGEAVLLSSKFVISQKIEIILFDMTYPHPSQKPYIDQHSLHCYLFILY